MYSYIISLFILYDLSISQYSLEYLIMFFEKVFMNYMTNLNTMGDRQYLVLISLGAVLDGLSYYNSDIIIEHTKCGKRYW